jgi:N-acetylglutamate synthase-like GNAT family acetyltransferase
MIAIKPFHPELQAQVAELVVQIQQAEFGIPISREDQPDLLDIGEFYQRDRGNFWVALDKGSVVGTIGLLDIGREHGALRKMFVNSDYRGGKQQVAPRLLQTLVNWSQRQGLRQLYLGTTQHFVAAHHFYEKNDFSLISREQLPPSFPQMGIDNRFYQRWLPRTT